MIRQAVVLGAVAVLVGFAPGSVAGQEPIDPVASNLARVFGMVERSFTALAEAMPAERYDFRPTGEAFEHARSFGEQVKHVACSNVAFFREVEQLEPPSQCDVGGPHPATTKAELLAYLGQSFEYANRVLLGMTPDNLLEPTHGPYGGEATRLQLTTLGIWHVSDHYGQLVVYLRMNGLVPPASRRQ